MESESCNSRWRTISRPCPASAGPDALFFSEDITSASGFSFNQEKKYAADDIVGGSLLFESGALFQGLWCFTVAGDEEQDTVEVVGSEGRIKFSVFDLFKLSIIKNGKSENIPFEKIQHVQQPMIEKVVEYFSGKTQNPCPPEAGVKVMEIMQSFTEKR
jgi:predicted dehydrogenase